MEHKRKCTCCGNEENFQEGELTRGQHDYYGTKPVYFDGYLEGEKKVNAVECKECGFLMLFTVEDK